MPRPGDRDAAREPLLQRSSAAAAATIPSSSSSSLLQPPAATALVATAAPSAQHGAAATASPDAPMTQRAPAVEAYAPATAARHALLGPLRALMLRGKSSSRARAKILAQRVPVGHPSATLYFIARRSAQPSTAASSGATMAPTGAAAAAAAGWGMDWDAADAQPLPPHPVLDLAAAGVLPLHVSELARAASWRAVFVVKYRRVLVLVCDAAAAAAHGGQLQCPASASDRSFLPGFTLDHRDNSQVHYSNGNFVVVYDIPSELPPTAAMFAAAARMDNSEARMLGPLPMQPPAQHKHRAATLAGSDDSGYHNHSVEDSTVIPSADHDRRKMTRAARHALFGDNEIIVPVQPRWSLLIDELTHPFFIFQLLAVILWVLEHYVMYAFAILVTSLGGAWLQAHEIHTNAQRLADLAANGKTQHTSDVDGHDSADLHNGEGLSLVPGDIVPVHIGETVPADCTLIDGAALINEASLTGESAPVRKSSWLPSREEISWSAPEVTLFAGTRVLTARPGSRAIVTRTACSTQRGDLVRDILLRPGEASGWGGVASSSSATPSLSSPCRSYGFQSSAWKSTSSVPMSDHLETSHELVDAPLLATTSQEVIAAPATDGQGVSREIYGTLMFLLVMGVVGAVWSTLRFVKMFKLPWSEAIIESLDLITITVPPALPATVTFGLAFAIGRLQAHRILCVRAAAVPRAGHVQVMCFDKTGTLTENGLDVHSVYSSEAMLDSKQVNLGAGRCPRTLTCVLHDHDTAASFDLRHTHVQDMQSQYSMGIPQQLGRALACCHALSLVDANLVGDEVDLRLFQLSKFDLIEDDLSTSQLFQKLPLSSQLPDFNFHDKRHSTSDGVIFKVRGDHHEISVVRLLDFRSDLARQGTVAILEDPEHTEHPKVFVFVKGAPEIIAGLSLESSVPGNLVDILNEHTSHGRRVLALASRSISCEQHKDAVDLALSIPRSELERNLTFLGLVVLENRLKRDTHTIISKIATNRSLETRLVTGDHATTSVSVARQSGILPGGVGVLQIKIANPASVELEIPTQADGRSALASDTCFEFFDPEDSSPGFRSYSLDEVFRLFKTYGSAECEGPKVSLVVTGPVFNAVQSNTKILDFVLRRGIIFARMSPSQKTDLIRGLKLHLGHNVLMCGDGANDVGALREADTGVALASTDDLNCFNELEQVVVSRSAMMPNSDAFQYSQGEGGLGNIGSSQNEGRPRNQPLPEGPPVQDTQQAASLAASFTSHGSSIGGTLEVIRQGRAAAAASLAAFRYMFLYSVIQFSSVMLLYSCGALVSDGQFLFVDLFLVMPLAVIMSRLDAAEQLHDKPPPRSIRERNVALPTFLLAAIQVAFQICVFVWVLPGVPQSEFPVEKGAGILTTKCALVTGMFVFVNMQYVATAVALNLGAPHRCSLSSSRAAFIGAVVSTCACVQLLVIPWSWQSWWLEMAPLDKSVRFSVCLLALLNCVSSVVVVRWFELS